MPWRKQHLQHVDVLTTQLRFIARWSPASLPAVQAVIDAFHVKAQQDEVQTHRVLLQAPSDERTD